MEIRIIMPSLLWLYTNDVSEKERQRSICTLEIYLARQMLRKQDSQGLNPIFLEMAKFLKDKKDQSAENRIWTDDPKLIDYPIMFPMLCSKVRKRMVFEAIETYVRSIQVRRAYW